jgi:hypothetical protein
MRLLAQRYLMDADVCQGVLSQAAQTLSYSLEGSGKAAPKENMRSRPQSGSLTQPLRLMLAKLLVAVMLAFMLEGVACLLSTEFEVLRHTQSLQKHERGLLGDKSLLVANTHTPR